MHRPFVLLGHCDPAAVLAELDAVPFSEWREHELPGYHTTTHALRRVVLWLATPAVTALLNQFGLSLVRARGSAVLPGGRVPLHRDAAGVARVSVVLRTDPAAWVQVGGERRHLAVGEVWYLDTTQLHGAGNDGAGVRVHLVLDCAWTERLRTAVA